MFRIWVSNPALSFYHSNFFRFLTLRIQKENVFALHCTTRYAVVVLALNKPQTSKHDWKLRWFRSFSFVVRNWPHKFAFTQLCHFPSCTKLSSHQPELQVSDLLGVWLVDTSWHSRIFRQIDFLFINCVLTATPDMRMTAIIYQLSLRMYSTSWRRRSNWRRRRIHREEMIQIWQSLAIIFPTRTGTLFVRASLMKF